MTSTVEQIVNRFVTTLNERDFDGFEALFTFNSTDIMRIRGHQLAEHSGAVDLHGLLQQLTTAWNHRLASEGSGLLIALRRGRRPRSARSTSPHPRTVEP